MTGGTGVIMSDSARTEATPDTAAPAVSLQDALVEFAARGATVFLLGVFAFAALHRWLADTSRITLLLIVVTESLTVGFALFSRTPRRRDWSPVALFSSIAATFYFLFIQLDTGTRIVSEAFGASLQAAGLLWQIYAKCSLRAAFGLLPAHRGIVTRGAYRVVRHPIYLGYFVADIGFLLVNFGPRNCALYLGLFTLLAVRILQEERLLSGDGEYCAYRDKVRYRVVPGVF